MKSFKIFFKLVWYLSVVVVFLFFIVIEIHRIYDYVMNNYSIQKMKIADYYYNYGISGKGGGTGTSIIVIGYISEERVYFSRFNEGIDKLYSLYPQFFSNDKKTYKIKVLKFEHSHRVMLADDDEFSKWKRNLLLSFSYIILSIIIALYIKNKKK